MPTKNSFDWTNATVDLQTRWFRVESNEGGWQRVVPRPGVVTIPYSGVLGAPDCRVVLVRQPRPSVEMNTLEFPRGAIEPGEDPIPAACREAVEESGFICDVDRAEIIGRVAPDTSGLGLILPVVAVPADFSKQVETDGETTGVEIMTLAEVIEAARRGEIICGLSLSSLAFIRAKALARL